MNLRRFTGTVAGLVLGSCVSAQADEPLAMQRLTPSDIVTLSAAAAAKGGGVQMTNLIGDPKKPGLYTVRVALAAHTKGGVHTHRDNRSITVLSGTWQVGYGTKFDDQGLKTLPAGSVYTEPAGQAHFSQAYDGPVVLLVTGFGPSDTKPVTP